jgi:arachidonate 15-lipoxygenase
VLDPFTDAKDQEIYNSEFDLPTLENRRAHWNVISSHAYRYLRLYYDSDQELREDTAIKAWINDLNHYVPNGVYKLLDDKLTIEGVARLVTAYIYAGTVEHEAIGTGLWNYQLWTHVQPVRVYKNGRREPVDLYQRLVNYNFILNVSRAPLLQDLSYLAGNDRAGAVAFSTFLAELADLQIRLKAEPDECWKLYPADLEVSVNS